MEAWLIAILFFAFLAVVATLVTIILFQAARRRTDPATLEADAIREHYEAELKTKDAAANRLRAVK